MNELIAAGYRMEVAANIACEPMLAIEKRDRLSLDAAHTYFVSVKGLPEINCFAGTLGGTANGDSGDWRQALQV